MGEFRLTVESTDGRSAQILTRLTPAEQARAQEEKLDKRGKGAGNGEAGDEEDLSSFSSFSSGASS